MLHNRGPFFFLEMKMDFTYLILVAVAVLVLVMLKVLGDWVDRAPWRRLTMAVTMILGAACVLQWRYPEMVSRITG